MINFSPDSKTSNIHKTFVENFKKIPGLYNTDKFIIIVLTISMLL